MTTFNSANFTLTFQSKGTTFFFEDLVLMEYLPLLESVTIYNKEGIKVFMSEDTLAEMNLQGEKRKVEETQSVIRLLTEEVEAAYAYCKNLKQQEDITKEMSEEVISRLLVVCKYYQYFDPNYWDSAFEHQNESKECDKNIKLVQGFKNEIRERLNDLYFGSQSLLQVMLIKISQKFKIQQEELHWYSAGEVIKIFENETVSKEILKARQEAYVFHKKPDGVCDTYIGSEAREIIAEFEERSSSEQSIITGKTANAIGIKVTGKVKIISRDYGDETKMRNDMAHMKEGDVLVSETTEPALMEALKKASAIITDIGGMLSHAAITARELGTPCIVGTVNASKVLKDGDIVEVDAEKGIIRILQ